FLATGIYGKPLPNQNGAPIRLVTPWKYGFKSIKSIVRFTFTDERPVSFWEELAAKEYGFWANVNPGIPHPRWPQKTERMLGTDERVPTMIFNGYRDQVEGLYANLGITDSRELYY
ncbi:MAG: molybdopterin-dependent oxidoreductase, partial [Alphaproteobacteria bacterium]